VLAVPLVDLELKRIAPGQKRPVLRRKVVNDRGKLGEEMVGINTGLGKRFRNQKVVQLLIDLQSVFFRCESCRASRMIFW